jgi:hypothetical protein
MSRCQKGLCNEEIIVFFTSILTKKVLTGLHFLSILYIEYLEKHFLCEILLLGGNIFVPLKEKKLSIDCLPG